MTLSAAEQLMLELVNRARLDPVGEAKRQKISLNKDLSPGTLDGEVRQVLAPDARLDASAESHADWMLATDTFSHTGRGGSSPHDRMEAAGYVFTGAWSSGENIALTGSTASINLNSEIVKAHNNLFKSAGHRLNILDDYYRELGVSQQEGDYQGYKTSMVAQNFATSGSGSFVTGVAFDDADRNKFYSIGEGVSGVTVSVGGQSADTARAGGYGLELSDDAPTVTLAWSTGRAQVQLDLSQGNAKLDLMNGTTLLTSADMTILSGNATGATLLGVGDIDLTGGAAGETLLGNNGDNVIDGGGGNDKIKAGRGNDTVSGGDGRDKVIGKGGSDRVSGGEGNDVVKGNGGSDRLFGDAGNDKLKGGGGNDTLQGGDGDDLLIGQRGADTFVFASGDDSDRIKNYELGRDALMLSDDLWTGSLTASEVVDRFATVVNGNAMFDFGGGDAITLNDVTDLGALASDILFG